MIVTCNSTIYDEAITIAICDAACDLRGIGIRIEIGRRLRSAMQLAICEAIGIRIGIGRRLKSAMRIAICDAIGIDVSGSHY